MNKSFNLIQLVKILIKWRLPIIVLIIVAALGSVISSLTMDEYYKSESIFYPINLSITDRQMLFSETSGEMLPGYFGNRRDIERVLTIARSESLAKAIIDSFKLYKVYDIDTTNEKWMFKAKREFGNNFTAKKTKLGAVSISVLDTDPERAANIVKAIVRIVDKRNREMVRNLKKGIVSSFNQKLNDKKKEVNKLTDTLVDIKSKYEIRKVSKGQVEEATYKANSPGAVEQYNVLKSRHQNALEELNRFSTLYEQYEVSTEQDFSSLYILEKAFAADKKSKPVRWLICVTTTLVAGFLGIIGSIMAEKFKDFKQALQNAE